MAKFLVMKDDGCGFGDQIACCPTCGEPFVVPFGFKGCVYSCSNCHEMCVVPGREQMYEKLHEECVKGREKNLF